MDDKQIPTSTIADNVRLLRAMLAYWWTGIQFPGGRQIAEPSKSVQAGLLFLLGAMAIALFAGRLDHPLLEPEEARYAEIPRQMLQEGCWVTPVLHGEEYWQKPPLLYWLVMLCYKAFGAHDWSARLVPAISGLICILATTFWAWRTLGFWAGFLSGMVLTLSMRYLYLAGMLSMDGLLCTCIIGGLAAGHLALTTENRRGLWLASSALACALGFLTKGPVAIALIVPPLIGVAMLDWRCRFLSRRECLLYAGIVLAIAGPWFIAMAIMAPQAAGSFFWLHNIQRYLTPLDHEKPMWFYAPSLALGMLPWTLLLIPMIPYLLRQS